MIPMTDDDVPAQLKAVILQWPIDAQKDEHALRELADWLNIDAEKLAAALKPCNFSKHRRMWQ